MLAKPNCVWEAVDLYNLKICLQFLKLTTASKTHFGLTKIGSKMHHYWATVFNFWNLYFGEFHCPKKGKISHFDQSWYVQIWVLGVLVNFSVIKLKTFLFQFWEAKIWNSLNFSVPKLAKCLIVVIQKAEIAILNNFVRPKSSYLFVKISPEIWFKFDFRRKKI